MASGRVWRGFIRSRTGFNFLKLLCFSAILAAGVGYGVYHFSVNAFMTNKSEEKITALQLVDAFVTNYSNLRAEFGSASAPVPASFRAHSIELFNKARSGDDVLRLLWVGRDGRELVTPPADARMAETIETFARDPHPKPQSTFLTANGQLVFRTVYPSIASQQSCVDCHNKIAPDKPEWHVNDVMGAFSIDVPAGGFLRTTTLYSCGLALIVFLMMAGVGLSISLMHYEQLTEREMGQGLVKESEARFRDFAESASDWFWEQDENLRFSYLSEPVTRSGIPPNAHLGKTRREVIFHGVTEQQWQAHQADLDARRPFQNFRFQRVSQTGELRNISVSGKPVFDHNGRFRGYRGTAKDITNEVMTELELARRVDERTTQLRKAQEELLRGERLSVLGQLTATVAHELRNPLSAIRNSVYALKEVIAARGLTADRPLTRIERSIGRCDRIVSDLLDYARSRQLQCAPLPLDGWLAEVLDEQKLPEHVVLVRKFGATDVVVAFDPDRLRRVVVNLVENAVQSLPDGAPHTRPLEIEVGTRQVTDQIEISFADDGSGIEPDVLPRIFEPLFSTKSFGTGLGLPTAKQIVEQHGGQIEVASEVGHGTRVIIRLPLPHTQEIAA